MLNKYLNAFFENTKYVPAGLKEMSAPIDQFINNVFHSTVFRILYFIPFAILKLLTIVLDWYYENFMNNDQMLQSSADRVLFVYLIPAAVIIGLVILLTKRDGIGWHILFASPIIFALFPIFAIWGIGWLISRFYNCHENSIEKKKEKLICNPPKNIKAIEDEGLKRGKLGEIILEYALKKVPGYKKILTNLYVPINGAADEYTEVDAVLINKHGVFVWDAKYLLAQYFYGRKNDDVWYKCHEEYVQELVEKELSTGEEDPRVKKFMNPLKQNRIHVNAIQKQLRLNGLANAHMFSGVAFTNMYESKCYIEHEADERACDVNKVPRAVKFWNKMSKTRISKKEVDKIANFLAQYENKSEEVREAHIKRLQNKYGVQTEDEIDINQMVVKVVKLRKRTA